MPHLLIILLLLILLVAAKEVSYVFFHSLVEIFSVIVAVNIFMFTWNARKIMKNNYFLFIGIAYLFVGLIDIIHTFAYKGMDVFPDVRGANIATQLWIAGRYMLSISLLIAPIFLYKKLNEKLALSIFSIITFLIMLAIFYWKIFPESYVDGIGVTSFKIISEYIVIGFFVIILGLLYKFKEKFNGQVFLLLSIAFFLNILAELAFTLYIGVYDIFNMLGHITKLSSYYLIYRAIISIGFSKPYNLLFLELQQIARKKDEFISIASHELKNPLTSIKAYAQLAQKQLIKNKDQKSYDYISKIQIQVNKINKLVDNLFDISKIESGKMLFNFMNVDFDQLVSDAVEECQAASSKHKIFIEGQTRAKLKVDKDRINQVLVNLIFNAIKYSPAAKKIIVKLGRLHNKVVLAVQDFGIGIIKGRQKNIFNKYYRTPRGRKTAEGLGLGLYISANIIKDHGGKIWVESKKGKGSTFYFSLPVIRGAS